MVKKRGLGFTLLELLVALAIIALLLSIAAPNYIGSVDRAREAILRENLATLRESIDKFYGDHGRYPQSINDLVAKRYLRRLPEDPITGVSTSWIVLPPDDPAKGGVFDVRSGAKGRASDGSAYRDW